MACSAAGASQHDYLLQGSADANSTAAMTGITLQIFAGTLLNAAATFTSPAHQNASSGGRESAFGFDRNARYGENGSEVFEVSFNLAAPAATGTRSQLLPERGDTFFLGERPASGASAAPT